MLTYTVVKVKRTLKQKLLKVIWLLKWEKSTHSINHSVDSWSLIQTKTKVLILNSVTMLEQAHQQPVEEARELLLS